MSLILRAAGAVTLLLSIFAAATFVGIPVAIGGVVGAVVLLALATILDTVRETAKRTDAIELTLHDLIRTTPSPATSHRPTPAEITEASAQQVRALMDSLVDAGFLSPEERETASALWQNDANFKTRAKRAAAMPPSDVRASEAQRLAHYIREQVVTKPA